MQASVQSNTLDGAASAQATACVLPVAFDGVAYAVRDTRILDGVSLILRPGAPTMVMGPNGSGKSTLLKLAMGLIEPTAGRITFDGAQSAPRCGRAFMFQKPVMLRRSVADNLAFALKTAGLPAEKSAMAQLLEMARLSPLSARPARRLSGGEQQRLALARAIARRPQLLLLDEPTASLDPASTRLVEEIIAQVAGQGTKIVMATHDLGQARRLGGDVVFLAGGNLVEHTPATTFFAQPASEAARRFLAGELLV